MSRLASCNEVTSIEYLRIKVDSRSQSIEPLVWWTSGGTRIPEITGSILVAVIIFPTSSHLGGTHIPEITGSILVVAVSIFPTSSHVVNDGRGL
jgi:hypothetical protein